MAQSTASGRHPHGGTGDGMDRASAWAAGGTLFAAVVLIVDGAMDILKGVTAIAADNIYAHIGNYVYEFDLTVWGWILLAIGIVAVLTGLALFKGRTWAKAVGVVIASLNLIANFMWLPYRPLWALISIGLAAWVIWALTHHSRHAEV